jgi:hypothetical protein
LNNLIKKFLQDTILDKTLPQLIERETITITWR